MLCATYLLMERTTIGFRGWTNLLGRGALLDAPEDRGPGPLLQWAGGGLHGGADGSKQVLTGGDQGISLVLEIEDPFFLNVPRCGPGVSRDDISWTRAISWKTTNDVPSNLSLAIAVCSWPELIPAIETGNRSTMFCIACRYKVSIHTQVLQGRVSSKFFDPYQTKPTPRTRRRRVCKTQILLDKEILNEKEEVQNSPNGRRKKVKKLLDRARRTTRLLSCWRLSRPRTTQRSRLTGSPVVVPSSQRTTCSSWSRGSPSITSSTNKWWSSRRLLGQRLYYELYLQVVEFEAQAAEQIVAYQDLDCWNCL